MTKSEFRQRLTELLKKNGFRKISISTSLFGRRARITCMDPKGNKRYLNGFIEYEKGVERVAIESASDDYDWVDEFEAYSALMED